METRDSKRVSPGILGQALIRGTSENGCEDVNTEGFDDPSSGLESARATGQANRSRLDPGNTPHPRDVPVNPCGE